MQTQNHHLKSNLMITLSEWEKGGQYEVINNHRIYTRHAGDSLAPTLLLIHGYPSASWDWEGMWDELTKHYHVITLDMLGFGLSDKPKDVHYSISLQADIFESYLQRFEISHYHILAHDYGDTVALELLARQVDNRSKIRIESLCFLNGGLFPETHKPLLIQKLLLSPLGSLISKLINKKKFHVNLQNVFGPSTPPSKEVVDTLWLLLTHNNGVAVMHKLINYITERKQNRERWVGAIVNSTISIKLIAGAKDPISGQHMIDHYRRLVPNANITTMSNLGHYPQVEDPDAISAAYLLFRQSV